MAEGLCEIDAQELNYDYIDSSISLSEMSKDEIQFVLHLLKEKQPKKIVEIGVSAGGGTYYLLNNMCEDAELYSVDIAKQYYRNPQKTTGYIASELCDEDKTSRWNTFFGQDIIECITDIGNDIDFVVIDTVHSMPGEFLSFFVILPYLSENATVVLHDIHLNYFSIKGGNRVGFNSYCTSLLFSTAVSQQKYVLKLDNGEISNIGAFDVNTFTKENIYNMFHALFVNWAYYPSMDMEMYKEFIQKHYSSHCSRYFNICVDMQHALLNSKSKKIVGFIKNIGRKPYYFVHRFINK